MNRWKYGNYEFRINPSSAEVSTELVGDTLRTLSGALVSQPSFLKDSYDVESVFYQPRSRVISQVSIQNAAFIRYESDRFYVLNKVNDRIDIYSRNMSSLTGSIPLTGVSNKSYMSFDIVGNIIWVVSKAGTTSDVVTQLNSSGSVISSGSVSKTIDCSGVRYFSGSLWLLRTTGKIDLIKPSDFTKTRTIVLPDGLYYSGISSDGNFLIVGNGDSYNKILHIDVASGKIVNQISPSNMGRPVDFAYDGKHYYVMSESNGIQKIEGNTVERDLFLFQHEISTKSFVDMYTDMGVKIRAVINDLSIRRRIGFEHLYDVSMSITKVDRG